MKKYISEKIEKISEDDIRQSLVPLLQVTSFDLLVSDKYIKNLIQSEELKGELTCIKNKVKIFLISWLIEGKVREKCKTDKIGYKRIGVLKKINVKENPEEEIFRTDYEDIVIPTDEKTWKMEPRYFTFLDEIVPLIASSWYLNNFSDQITDEMNEKSTEVKQKIFKDKNNNIEGNVKTFGYILHSKNTKGYLEKFINKNIGPGAYSSIPEYDISEPFLYLNWPWTYEWYTKSIEHFSDKENKKRIYIKTDLKNAFEKLLDRYEVAENKKRNNTHVMHVVDQQQSFNDDLMFKIKEKWLEENSKYIWMEKLLDLQQALSTSDTIDYKGIKYGNMPESYVLANFHLIEFKYRFIEKMLELFKDKGIKHIATFSYVDDNTFIFEFENDMEKESILKVQEIINTEIENGQTLAERNKIGGYELNSSKTDIFNYSKVTQMLNEIEIASGVFLGQINGVDINIKSTNELTGKNNKEKRRYSILKTKIEKLMITNKWNLGEILKVEESLNKDSKEKNELCLLLVNSLSNKYSTTIFKEFLGNFKNDPSNFYVIKKLFIELVNSGISFNTQEQNQYDLDVTSKELLITQILSVLLYLSKSNEKYFTDMLNLISYSFIDEFNSEMKKLPFSMLKKFNISEDEKEEGNCGECGELHISSYSKHVFNLVNDCNIDIKIENDLKIVEAEKYEESYLAILLLKTILKDIERRNESKKQTLKIVDEKKYVLKSYEIVPNWFKTFEFYGGKWSIKEGKVEATKSLSSIKKIMKKTFRYILGDSSLLLRRIIYAIDLSKNRNQIFKNFKEILNHTISINKKGQEEFNNNIVFSDIDSEDEEIFSIFRRLLSKDSKNIDSKNIDDLTFKKLDFLICFRDIISRQWKQGSREFSYYSLHDNYHNDKLAIIFNAISLAITDKKMNNFTILLSLYFHDVGLLDDKHLMEYNSIADSIFANNQIGSSKEAYINIRATASNQARKKHGGTSTLYIPWVHGILSKNNEKPFKEEVMSALVASEIHSQWNIEDHPTLYSLLQKSTDANKKEYFAVSLIDILHVEHKRTPRPTRAIGVTNMDEMNILHWMSDYITRKYSISIDLSPSKDSKEMSSIELTAWYDSNLVDYFYKKFKDMISKFLADNKNNFPDFTNYNFGNLKELILTGIITDKNVDSEDKIDNTQEKKVMLSNFFYKEQEQWINSKQENLSFQSIYDDVKIKFVSRPIKKKEIHIKVPEINSEEDEVVIKSIEKIFKEKINHFASEFNLKKLKI